MKRTIAIFVSLVILVLPILSGASGIVQEDEVPEFIMNYFESSALPYYKSFISNADNGFIPRYFSSKEEVDLLKAGSVYRLYNINGNEGRISDVIEPSNGWLFTLDLDEPKVFIDIFEEDPLDFYGPVTAENLVAVFDVLKRTADNAGVEFKPILIDYGWHYLIAYMSFNGDERVIPIPTTAFKLDEEYAAVTSYLELPTGDDLMSEMQRLSARSVTNENGEYVYGTNSTIHLTPNIGSGDKVISASVSNSSSLLKGMIPVLASAALIAVIAIAVLQRKKQRISSYSES